MFANDTYNIIAASNVSVAIRIFCCDGIALKYDRARNTNPENYRTGR